MKEYLGDSVYAEYTEHEVVDVITLTTENGGPPSNTIVIDDQVFKNLIEFANRIRAKYSAEPIVIPREYK